MPEVPLRILHVASEMVPFAKTGGLADVVHALPKALATLGHDARVALPCYRRCYLEAQRLGVTWAEQPLVIEAGGVDHRVGVGTVRVDGITVHLLACNELYDRDGLYGPGPGHDYEDNCRRYSVLAKAALALPRALGWIPHIVHAHDWQAGLVPVLRERGFNRDLPATRTVFTIHNIAYQGSFPAAQMRLTGLHPALYNPYQCEQFGRLNLLKAGIVFADRVSTVSRTYADEIQTPAYAYGLDDCLRGHAYKLAGIVNGIDADSWDPARDPLLPQHFDTRRLDGKRVCKDRLRAELGLQPQPRPALVAMVSRLVAQKGVDLVAAAASPYILAGRMQLAVLGSGDPHLEQQLTQLQARHPGWVHTWHGYNEALAHRLIAGADIFLVPSREEPCGLTQLYSKRYGTLPLVRHTGGLADTVIDVNVRDGAGQSVGTGFSFGPVDVGHFSSALDRALGLYEHYPEAWRAAQLRAMRDDHSWDRAAGEYLALYRAIACG